MRQTYLKIRRKIAKISNKFLKKTGLNQYIDIEFFDHFVLLGLLFHSILLIFLPPAFVIISAFAVGIGKELFDKFFIKSNFSPRGAFLTILGGAIPVVARFAVKETPPDVLWGVLGLIIGFIFLTALLMLKKK